MADLAGKMPKPGKPTVGVPRQKKATDKIVKGSTGKVTTNSIGRASSVAGSETFGRPIRGRVYPMTAPGNLCYGGPVEKRRIEYDQESN